ncbi:MAG TPA: type II secretion system protein [Planctomycetota bacterium]|nr:type II secretion system protein [Planctomycetota bacterium]
MTGHGSRRAFTLIELLVVMGIMLVLAGLLLTGISAARRHVQRARTRAEIDRMMMALTEYYNEFDKYPPGGTDSNDNGVLGDIGGEEKGAGKEPADLLHPTALELQLRTICTKLTIEGGNRTVGPYYNPREIRIVNHALTDVFGNSWNYLSDGRRTTLVDGLRAPSRIHKLGPVLWSIAEDARQDVENDNEDNNSDGKVDDPSELVNDLCSWNG